MNRPILPIKRRFNTYEEAVATCFVEEISGVEYFRHLSLTLPERYRTALHLLSHIEILMADLLRPLLPRGPAMDLAEVRRSGRDQATVDGALPWDELSVHLARSMEVYNLEYEDIHRIAPSHDKSAMRILKDHGEVLWVFFTESYQTCDVALLERFIENHAPHPFAAGLPGAGP